MLTSYKLKGLEMACKFCTANLYPYHFKEVKFIKPFIGQKLKVWAEPT